ncbi:MULTISPECIES: methyl-accepting chemotaxis protein [unclassified Acinetobacter]|uniref:methyl-accepting chemotaxis protein n=1 Tax=unclassified Acinetobacter TaxID=196816 RepID=UPI002934DE7C|nr:MULTISPECIES: methyl-accepting chemotaxis protein [unclassified Acinetobacter]WOE32855.1 methyl-accepting chemotaxis protein [Acinetobacter sp. SAAs470]WOE38332.1 methyl-accepting chemotaxis protein [Acinetobacter sp. SAAs474]
MVGDQQQKNNMAQSIYSSKGHLDKPPSYFKKIQLTVKFICQSKRLFTVMMIMLFAMSISLLLLVQRYYLNTSFTELRVLSQRISHQVGEVITINTPDEITRLRDLQTQFNDNLNQLKYWSIDGNQITAIEDQWVMISKQIDFIVKQKKLINQLYDNHIAMTEIVPAIQIEYQSMMAQMLTIPISSQHILLLSEQIIRVQQILKLIEPEFLISNFSIEDADQLNKDMQLFTDHLNTQFQPKTAGGIQPITDPKLTSILQNIQVAYDDVIQPASAVVLANINPILQIQKTVTQVPNQIVQLSEDLTARSVSSWSWLLWPILTMILMFIILLIYIYQLVNLQHHHDVVAHQDDHNDQIQAQYQQNAMLRLLDEINQLNQGSLPLSPTNTENFNSMTDAINIAIQQLHQFMATVHHQTKILQQHDINVENVIARLIEYCDHQNQKIIDISFNINDMLVLREQLFENIESCHFISQRLAVAVSKINQIDGMGNDVQMINQKIQAILAEIPSFEFSLPDFDQVTSLIDELSAQSHVLAMNTAIQARKSDQPSNTILLMLADEAQNMTQRVAMMQKRLRSWQEDIQKSFQEIISSIQQHQIEETAVDLNTTQDIHAIFNEITAQSAQLNQLMSNITEGLKRDVYFTHHIAITMESIQEITSQKSLIILEMTTNMTELRQIVDSLQHLLSKPERLDVVAEI